jgi:hypothetical protein
MKVSELIRELEFFQKEHGDQPVFCRCLKCYIYGEANEVEEAHLSYFRKYADKEIAPIIRIIPLSRL